MTTETQATWSNDSARAMSMGFMLATIDGFRGMLAKKGTAPSLVLAGMVDMVEKMGHIAAKDEWPTDSDRVLGLGVIARLVATFKGMVAMPNNDPSRIIHGMADVAEQIAKSEFGEHWPQFVGYVRRAMVQR